MRIPVKNMIRETLRRTPLRSAVMAYRHLGLRAADVFLASYPRSGNTWLKSLISSCLFGEAMTNFSDTHDPVIPIVGFHRGVRPLIRENGRLIKTHEPYRSQYQRAIWIVRDPRDVLVSEYRLALRTKRFDGTLDDYTRLFVSQPRCGVCNWQSHTDSWAGSPIAGTPQLLLLRFEELRKDPHENLERILSFIGVAPTKEVVERAVAQNSIESMAERHAAYDRSLGESIATAIPAVNKGATGGWRKSVSEVSLRMLHTAFGETMARAGYVPDPAEVPQSAEIQKRPHPDHS